jgi:hypothetical protein
VNRGQAPRTYATGVRLRTQNSKDWKKTRQSYRVQRCNLATVRYSLHRTAQACIRNPADILNNVSNCKYVRYCLVMVFALTFPFTWFSFLVLRVFAAVYLKCFSAISFKARFCHSLFLIVFADIRVSIY